MVNSINSQMNIEHVIPSENLRSDPIIVIVLVPVMRFVYENKNRKNKKNGDFWRDTESSALIEYYIVLIRDASLFRSPFCECAIIHSFCFNIQLVRLKTEMKWNEMNLIKSDYFGLCWLASMMNVTVVLKAWNDWAVRCLHIEDNAKLVESARQTAVEITVRGRSGSATGYRREKRKQLRRCDNRIRRRIKKWERQKIGEKNIPPSNSMHADLFRCEREQAGDERREITLRTRTNVIIHKNKNINYAPCGSGMQFKRKLLCATNEFKSDGMNVKKRKSDQVFVWAPFAWRYFCYAPRVCTIHVNKHFTI